MSMKLPPKRHTELTNLVTKFNETKKDAHVQRLFYLQKINYELNRTTPDEKLYNWVNSNDKQGFHAQLAKYSINPDASFFLKGIQFAEAIFLNSEKKYIANPDKPVLSDREYQIMQRRDAILESGTFDTVSEEYLDLSLELRDLAHADERMKAMIEKQAKILKDVQPKIDAIKGSKKPEEIALLGISYKTDPLGPQGNNQNYKFKMGGWDEPMVFRVEDRSDLRLEQALHSHPVSKYFIEDFALFTKKLQNRFCPVEYRPIVLSQYATQGNLAEVAKRIQNESVHNVAPKIGFYFVQLTHFIDLLIDAKAYHPDMKLTNFLAHRNRILISDRKTLIDNPNPMADTVRSSPVYAPDEYIECIDFDSDPLDFNEKASTTTLNMPQFMAYQLGMVLKEFLLLTQMDELPPVEEFRNADKSAASYFASPPKQIINLSLLVQELTRSDASKRMTIQQFKSLLKFRNQEPDNFYKEVEKVFPSADLGIQSEMDEINALLDERKNESGFQKVARSFMDMLMPSYYGNDLLHRANKIFDKISMSVPKETRLTRMAEKLAVKCYKEYAHLYFEECSQSIENALFNNDWNQAPWYRKAMHWLTFGLYSIDRSPSQDISKIKIEQKLHGATFQTHFPLLEFLPSAELDNLGTLKSAHFKEFLFSHINEIVPQDSDSSEELTSNTSEMDESGSLIGSSEKQSADEHSKLPSGSIKIKKDENASASDSDDSLPSGTMVIKKDEAQPATNSDSSLPSATMVIKKKKSDKPAESKDSLPSDTMVIKKEDKPSATKSDDSLPSATMVVKKKKGDKAIESKDSLPSETMLIKKDETDEEELPSATVVRKKVEGKAKMSFSFIKQSFFRPKEQNAEGDTKPRYHVPRYYRVDSVRTALLRGDGSHRIKDQTDTRPRIEDINWQPASMKKP